MSFLAQAKLTDDNGLIMRVAACVAGHGIADPRMWAVTHMWQLGAQKGWGEAYAKALATEPPAILQPMSRPRAKIPT